MSMEVLSVRGLRPECGKVDRDLWLWFCEAKKDSENYHGPRVTKRLVQAKAKEAFKAAGILNFKASDGWYIRWLKRWHRIGTENAKRMVTKDGSPTKLQLIKNKETQRLKIKSPKAKVLSCSTAAPVNACDDHETVDSHQNPDKQILAQISVPLYCNNATNNQISPENSLKTSSNPVKGITFQEGNNATPNNQLLPFKTFTCINKDEKTLIHFSDSTCYNHSKQIFDSRNVDSTKFPDSGSLKPGFFPQLAHTKRRSLKHPIEDASKVVHSHKSSGSASISSIQGTATEVAKSSNRKCKDMKTAAHVLCVEQISTVAQNNILDQNLVGEASGEKLSVCSENTQPSNIPPVQYLLPSSDCHDGPDLVESNFLLPSSTYFTSAKNLSNMTLNPESNNCKNQEVFSIEMKSSDIQESIISSDVFFTVEPVLGFEPAGCANGMVLKENVEPTIEENFSDLINVGSGTEPICGNFERDIVHHDLEDVSVSSDFVNQLNDELSLELNLECGHVNYSNQVCPSVTFNPKYKDTAGKSENIFLKSQSSSPVTFVNHGGCDAFVSSSNVCIVPKSGGLISSDQADADSDFTSDENDYISEAVMLSMQEDDFSILNCDQSPFQGTISVIDEDSQQECEKVTDLDDFSGEELSATSASVEDQIVFPPCTASEELINADHEDTFPSSVSGRSSSVHKVMQSSVGNLQSSSEDVALPCEGNRSLEPENLHDVFFPAFSSEGDILNDSSCTFLTSSCGGSETFYSTQTVPSSPIDESSIFQISSSFVESRGTRTKEDFDLISTKTDIGQGQNAFLVSSTVDHIASLRAQDLFKTSSSTSNDVTAQVHRTSCHSDVSKVDISSQSTYSTLHFPDERQQSLILSGGPNINKADGISNVSVFPFSRVEEKVTEMRNHHHPSDFVLDDTFSAKSSLALSMNSNGLSHLGRTITDADSTTPLVSHSTNNLTSACESRLASPSSYVYIVKNSCLLPSNFSSKVNNSKSISVASSQTLCGLSVSKDLLESINPTLIETSTKSMNFESSKENGYSSQGLQKAEALPSIGSTNQSKLMKKSSTYLTEKGTNATRAESSVGEVKISCRRSSGDRYFPYFKERVADYAIKHTAKEAARYFGVNVDTVTMWTRGRHENDSKVTRNYPDQLMLRWLKINRENGVILTREKIVEKALQLLKTPGSWVKDKSRWFHVWASRLAEEVRRNQPSNDTAATNPLPIDCGEKKALYPDEFKVEVVLHAEQTSKNLASSIFNIARKRVFEWSAALKASKKLHEEHSTSIAVQNNNLMSTATDPQSSNTPLNGTGLQSDRPLPVSCVRDGVMKYKFNGKGVGRAVTNIAVDRELWEWFCEQTSKKSKPKSREIRAKAVELFRAHNHDKIQCSHGWLKKWSLRYGIALRHEGDGDLLSWCLEQFDRNCNISHRDLLNHAQESLTGTHKSEFKASAGWLVRFCKRHRSLLSAKPTIDVEIPAVLKPKVSEFRSQIQHLIHSSGIPLKNIGSMDEIPLNFTAVGSGTRSSLLLRRSGLENSHATVVLSCLANGELLPPAIIFKGEGPMEQVTFDGVPILILYQQECCMTADLMLQWLDYIWSRNVTSPSVLVADCYNPHSEESVANACMSANISLSVIPPGCSYKLQPLDLAISRQFEAHLYNKWTRHFSAVDQLSACKRTSYSSNTDIAGWVAEAFSNLKLTRKEAVCRSFLVTGLTAALNGSEDHLIEDPSYIPFSSLFTTQP